MRRPWITSLTFLEEETFQPHISDGEETFKTELQETTEVVTSDHDKLVNRDKENQHPIKAITDLSRELNGRLQVDSSITNEEIEQMMK